MAGCGSGRRFAIVRPWTDEQVREFHFHNEHVGLYFAREHGSTDLRFTVYASGEYGRSTIRIACPGIKRYLTVVDLGPDRPFSAIYPLGPDVKPVDAIEVEIRAGRRRLVQHSLPWQDVLELLPESSR